MALDVEQAGTYAVHLPRLDGFEEVEPIQVEVRLREISEVVFQLRRAR